MQELKAHTQTVQSIAFARDAGIFATAGDDRRICIWDTGSGQLRLAVRHAHDARIHHVAIAVNGQLLCSTGADRTARLWKHTGTVESSILSRREVSPICGSAFSPDGSLLLVAHSVSMIAGEIWEVREPAEIHVWRLPQLEMVACWSAWAGRRHFSPNGKFLITTGHPGLNFWKVDGFSLAASARTRLPVTSLTFSPDGSRLGVLTSREASIWTVEPLVQQCVFTRASKDLSCLAFTPDGRTLLIGGHDGTLTAWDTTTWQQRFTFQVVPNGRVRCVGVSPDGMTAVVGGARGLLLRFDLE